MRAVLWIVGIAGGALLLLGLLLEAARWLVIIGGIALVAVAVLGFLQGRRAARRQPPSRR
ncbi:hypothetical protein [Micromonospora sp. CPCC 205556]|uniref:hypothetical protein n=1 Tax=Micromonospora sp. CPCC 205556 TaxID=3122398 RepID=UPI002FF21AC2